MDITVTKSHKSQASCTQEIAPSRTKPFPVKTGENMKIQLQQKESVLSIFSLNGFPRLRTMLLKNVFL